MKRLFFTLALALLLVTPVLGANYEKWDGDAIKQVTLSTTPSATDLEGTVEIYELVIVINKDATSYIGVTVITPTEDGSGMTNFATSQDVIPPLGRLVVRNEKALEIKACSDTGTPDIIIVRKYRVN